MSSVSVRVNFERLRERLSSERGRPLTPYDVRAWLADEGFRMSRGEWLIAPDGADLREEEVVDRIELETENGVTFATTRHSHQQAS
jgi:hypothetical protein